MRVLITGGSRGIGAACVEYFLQQGAEITATARSVEGLSGEVSWIACDYENLEQWKQFLITVTASSWDILINNVGEIDREGFVSGGSQESLIRSFEVNLFRHTELAQQVVKSMFAQKKGVIVNVTSLYGHLPAPAIGYYGAAKAALTYMTKTMALDFAPYVRVNAVAPGVIDTDMTRSGNKKHLQTTLEKIPLQRLGAPKEVAQTIGFLCSEEASYITGQEIIVDGGLSLWS